jgi:hypothetical protein
MNENYYIKEDVNTSEKEDRHQHASTLLQSQQRIFGRATKTKESV